MNKQYAFIPICLSICATEAVLGIYVSETVFHRNTSPSAMPTWVHCAVAKSSI